MTPFNNKKVKTLFANICCSRCKNNFTENSIKIIEEIGDIYLIELECEKCLKSFGQVIIRATKNNNFPLEIVQGPDPISYDDVIDAHRFIKDNL